MWRTNGILLGSTGTFSTGAEKQKCIGNFKQHRKKWQKQKCKTWRKLESIDFFNDRC